MANLKDGAFTGDKDEGNPYSGDRGKGIAYDRYEADYLAVCPEGGSSRISTGYRVGARELISYSRAGEGDKILDLGSGTGIATLELLLQKGDVSVVGVELSEGMIQVARYKFHQDKGEEILSEVEDKKLLDYWSRFREESNPFGDKVQFIAGDFQEIDSLDEESYDVAVGNQFMHWTDLGTTFRQLNRFLKSKGEVVWNSASHFYDNHCFPAAEYGFRYNDFLAYVLDDLSKNGLEVKDYRQLSKPSYNLTLIETISHNTRFDTRQVATLLKPVDLQIFVQNHVPVFARQLVASGVDREDEEESRGFEEELQAKIKEAISRTIVNPKAMSDTKHKYDIIPFFRSTKKS